MKKFKKNMKGMTLIEIIVALAIFSIASSVMVVMCVAVTKMTADNESINRKISYGAPVADNQNIGINRAETAVPATEIINIKYGAQDIAISGDRYYAKDADGNILHDKDFQFFVVSELPVSSTPVSP